MRKGARWEAFAFTHLAGPRSSSTKSAPCGRERRGGDILYQGRFVRREIAGAIKPVTDAAAPFRIVCSWALGIFQSCPLRQEAAMGIRLIWLPVTCRASKRARSPRCYGNEPTESRCSASGGDEVRQCPVGKRGEAAGIGGQRIAAPHDVEVGPHQDEVVAVDVAGTLVGKVERRDRARRWPRRRGRAAAASCARRRSAAAYSRGHSRRGPAPRCRRSSQTWGRRAPGQVVGT